MTKKLRAAKGRLISSTEVYRGPAFWVTTDYVVEPSGVEARRDMVRHNGSVVIMPVKKGKKEPEVLLVRQYRHAAQQHLWELCAGRIDPGEKELPAAKRELLEETGISARRWKRVLYFWASPGFVAETMAIYLATELKQGEARPEEDEVIEPRFFPVSHATRMVMSGQVHDGKTISGVLWLREVLRGKNKLPKL
jgi:ADP-ribose pyrophosphatase